MTKEGANKLGEAKINREKMAKQVANGIVAVDFRLDPIPQLTCVLGIEGITQRHYKRVQDDIPINHATPQLAVGYFLHKAYESGAQKHVRDAALFALEWATQHPEFGDEVRALIDQVGSAKHSLGFSYIGDLADFTFLVTTGFANIGLQMAGKPVPDDKYPVPTQELRSPEEWRTLVDPALTEQVIDEEVHIAFFEPPDASDDGHSVSIMIPETPMPEILLAVKLATKSKGRLWFCCDTTDEVNFMVDLAGQILPDYRRIPYERAIMGAWGSNLS